MHRVASDPFLLPTPGLDTSVSESVRYKEADMTLVDQTGHDISTPELTKEQRLDIMEADLVQDVASMKDYVVQAREKVADMEQNVVKMENRLSDFRWLRHGDAPVSVVEPAEQDDYKLNTEGSPQSEPEKG